MAFAASCRCSAVRLELGERPESLTDCNCSICRRYGALWAYYPGALVRVSAEPDALEPYRTEEGTLAFNHCRRCGCVMFWRRDGKDNRIGVNARMMSPDDLVGVPIRLLDGASSWRRADGGVYAKPFPT